MYDMYRWNQPAGAGDMATQAPAPARRGRAARPAAGRRGEAARAVQEALDRRDNGGDSAAHRDQ